MLTKNLVILQRQQKFVQKYKKRLVSLTPPSAKPKNDDRRL
jgi:hypothetical protein